MLKNLVIIAFTAGMAGFMLTLGYAVRTILRDFGPWLGIGASLSIVMAFFCFALLIDGPPALSNSRTRREPR